MRLVFASLLAVAAVPVLAQNMPTEAPGAPDPARVVAGTYDVDADHTQVLFTVTHLGFSTYTGMFIAPTGTLTIDPRNPSAATVDITFPIAKVRTTAAGLDEHLQNADFFDAAKFPTGHFVSTKVTIANETAQIDGNLTLKGVTRPVTLDAQFVGAGKSPMGPPKVNVGFAATTTIKRSDFGISYGIPLVSDEVLLTINAAFVQR
ncbi:YceI family protein [Hephaestia sp. GCM10023244]|uniref:YceI family protein n=1 Tax=unclassified Hephaestia TaxID=2631281 RepID=UPI0020777E61|nr:YceI family protein [Hephaestia sp. MAHUQ-44]MCM8730021.1 YceI family protein [Hephaestia sp. MAHUQ-44]